MQQQLPGLCLVFDAQSQIVISFLVTQDTKPEFALLLSCFIKKLITGWLTFFQFDCLTPLCCLDSWQTVIASKALKIFQQHLPGNQIHHQVVNHQQNPCGRNLWPLRSEKMPPSQGINCRRDPNWNLRYVVLLKSDGPAFHLLETVWTTKSQVLTSSFPQKAFRIKPSVSYSGLQSITFHCHAQKGSSKCQTSPKKEVLQQEVVRAPNLSDLVVLDRIHPAGPTSLVQFRIEPYGFMLGNRPLNGHNRNGFAFSSQGARWSKHIQNCRLWGLNLIHVLSRTSTDSGARSRGRNCCTFPEKPENFLQSTRLESTVDFMDFCSTPYRPGIVVLHTPLDLFGTRTHGLETLKFPHLQVNLQE